MDELRNRWLNPPEWTREELLEFPGSLDGPWKRYIDAAPLECGDSSPLSLNDPGAESAVRLTQRGGKVKESDDRSSHSKVGTVRYPRIVAKDEECAKQLKKRTLTNLYNERPTWLDLAHQKLDKAVFTAYGWQPDISDDALLAKLLELNLQRTHKQTDS